MGWPRNPFRRRSHPQSRPRRPIDGGARPSHESWKPGDLAECLHDGGWFSGSTGMNAPGPRQGEIRMVERVVFQPWPTVTAEPVEGLIFARYGHEGYVSTAFRKIVPRADRAEAGTAATLDDLMPGRSSPALGTADA